jgi:hypothetical protein
MTQFSLAQTKLIAKIEAGACVKFDSTTGGYVLVENGVQRKVHLRTITALLSGGMYQTLMGYCVLAPSSDTAADTMAA